MVSLTLETSGTKPSEPPYRCASGWSQQLNPGLNIHPCQSTALHIELNALRSRFTLILTWFLSLLRLFFFCLVRFLFAVRFFLTFLPPGKTTDGHSRIWKRLSGYELACALCLCCKQSLNFSTKCCAYSGRKIWIESKVFTINPSLLHCAINIILSNDEYKNEIVHFDQFYVEKQ